MRVIVAGSRDLLDPFEVEEAIWESGFLIDEIVSGCARGIDSNGQQFAKRHNLPCKQMPAAWRDKDGEYNAAAGKQRNAEMAEYADALVAVWDGQSPGTRDMIARMKNKPTHVKIVQIQNLRYANNELVT